MFIDKQRKNHDADTFRGDGGVIRILIAESQELVRLGLRTLLREDHELELVGEAANFAETASFAKKLSPDLLLLDLTLGDDLIVDRIPQLLDVSGKLKVLALTANQDKEIHRLALQMGARGVFIKSAPNALLLRAIHRIHAGEIWVDRHATAAFFNHFQSALKPTPATDNKDKLTAREREIAVLAAQGLPAKKIATRIQISDKTVRNLLVFVYSKLGVSGQIELAIKARQLGLTPTSG